MALPAAEGQGSPDAGVSVARGGRAQEELGHIRQGRAGG